MDTLIQSAPIGRQASTSLSLIARATALFVHWSERRRQRLALAALDAHALADIGVTRSDAQREAEQPFWR